MAELSVLALTLSRIHLLSFFVQAACVVVLVAGNFLWVRHASAGPGLMVGGLVGFVACVALRRWIVWYGRRRGWGDDAEPAADPGSVPPPGRDDQEV
jgi:hypothetical protein